MRWQGSCWLAGADGPCSGHYEWHHLVRQQLIRDVLGKGTEICEHALGDPRLMADTCDGHHQALTTGALRVPRRLLPAEAFEAAADYGLMNAIDREYGVETDLAAAIAARTSYSRRVVEGWLAARRVRVDGEVMPWGAVLPEYATLADVTLDGRAIL